MHATIHEVVGKLLPLIPRNKKAQAQKILKDWLEKHWNVSPNLEVVNPDWVKAFVEEECDKLRGWKRVFDTDLLMRISAIGLAIATIV